MIENSNVGCVLAHTTERGRAIRVMMKSGLRAWSVRASTHPTKLLQLAVVAVVAAALVAAVEASDAGPQPLRFIRVYAPAEQPQLWPRGRGRYLPIDSDDFQRLLEDAKASQANSSTPKASVAQAQYRIRLDEDGTIRATARLHVLSHAEGPLLLPLEPCRFAIARPRWAANASASDNPATPAILGTDGSGQTALVVERSGELLFDCTMRGRRMRQSGEVGSGSDGVGGVENGAVAQTEFDLELPKCPRNVLLLDLPRDIIPQVGHGIIVRVNETSEKPSTQTPSTSRLVRWRIDLGGRNRVKLRLTPEGVAGGVSSAIHLTQSLVYDIAERGLEVSSDWHLDVSSSPIDRVELIVDSPLRVIRAQCGDQPVKWSVMSAGGGKTRRVSLELPQPIQGTGRSLQVWAYAPLVIGRAWPLPRIQVHSAGSENAPSKARKVFWEQGKATLLLADPLQLADIRAIDCRLSKVARLPPPDSGESVQLQLFSADARPQIVLSRAQSLPLVDLGIATRLDAGEMTALVSAKLRGNRQEQFQIEAQLRQQWIVDSVQSQPAGAVADWRVENGGDGSRRLEVRLARPLSPRRGTMHLIVGLRYPRSPLGRKLSIDDLLPLDFANCRPGKSLLAIHAVEPYRLKTWGKASLSLAEADSLHADDLSLFAQPPKGLVVSTPEAAESLSVSLQRRRPSYEASIRVEARAEGDLLLESYQIRCLPRSTQVERVLIHFSRARGSALRWWLGSEDNQQIEARRLPAAEEAAAGLDGDGETWEISLRQPRSEPFEISAARTTRLDQETAVCLAALPEASLQKATLLIRSNDVTAGRFENHRLEPISSEPIQPQRYSTIRATYRYNPLHMLSSSQQAELTVLPAATKGAANRTDENATESACPSAWAWSCQLHSYFNPDGAARHSAMYLIENAGRAQLRLTLPETIEPADVQGIWLNDKPLTWQTTVTKRNSSLRVDLPEGERFLTVTVHFTTTNSWLGATESLRPLMPAVDIPMLGRYWTVWLPPGYAPLVGEHETMCGFAPPVALPSLTQRVFGPLGRPLHDKTFDPFLAEDWKNIARHLFNPSPNEQAAGLLLERIGRLAQETASDGFAWADILGNQSFGDVGRPLLIEADAFAQAGIRPVTADARSQPPQLPAAPLPPQLESETVATQGNPSAGMTPASGGIAGEEAMGRAIRLLRRRGMAVLLHDEAMVLTTSARAAVYAGHLKPYGGVVWRVCPGSLSDWISTAATAGGQNENYHTLVSASSWAKSPGGPQSPWSTAVPGSFQTADTPGWTAVRLDISGDEAVALTVVHLQTLGIFRWTAFILTVALGCWKGMDQPLRLSFGLAISAILALLSPVLLSTTASGVFLGLLFCLLLRLIRRQPATDDSKSAVTKAPPSASRSTATHIASGMVLAMAMLCSNTSEAQTAKPHALKSKDRSHTYRVIVPADEKREATGGRVFVPEEFYRRLHLRAATATGSPRGWLLTSATYRGALIRQDQPRRLAIDSLQAVFDIRLFDRAAEVLIPLKKQDVSIVASACLLDGRMVQPTWSEDGRSIVVPVEQPGRHRLELSLRPSEKHIEKPRTTSEAEAKPQAVKGNGELDFAIPRLNNSHLELILPVGEWAVEVPSAGGPVTNQNGLLTAELGGSDRLSIRWRDSNTRPLVKASIQADELLWLKILPGSVVVDAKFVVKVEAGAVRTIMLEADPRLRLLNHADTADIVDVPGKPHLRLIQLKEPCTDEVVVSASFLLRDASGVGNVRPPRLRLANVSATTRRLAVSIDPSLDSPSLDSRPQDRRLPTPADISEFMADWGNTKVKPQSAYLLADVDPAWSISTRPRRPPIEVVQSLGVTFSQKRIEVRLDAKLTDTPGYGFKYRLASPPEMVIDKVSLLEEGVQRVSRWSRDRDGMLSIFLSGPAAVERHLSLQGHIATPPQGKIDVPTFHLQDGRLESTRIALLRDRSVLVSIVKSRGLIESNWPSAVEIAAAAGGSGLGPAHPLKSFISDGIQPVELQVALVANRPKTKMVQTTILAPAGDSGGKPWTATVDLRIAVTDGLLDEVILDVPQQFGGPYELRQPGTIEVIDASDRRRRLVVRPHSPIAGQGRLTITSPLSSEPLAAPRITPSNVAKLTQILVLPKRNGPLPITWEIRGLKKTSLADNYEVVDGRFSAVLVSAQKGQGNAVVRLADVNIVWRADGTCSGTATFDLIPDGRLWCPLWLPRQYQLIETRLDHAVGVPVVDGESSSAGREYRIQLASRTLPQRIEVVFRGRLRTDQWRERQPWDAPRLGDLPVEKTLWRVCGPRQFPPSRPATAAQRLQHELIRLENVAAIIEQGIALPNRKADELRDWYHPWAHRCGDVQHEVLRATAAVNQLDPARTARDLLKRFDDRQREIAKELQAEDILNRRREEIPAAIDTGALWETTLASAGPIALLLEDRRQSPGSGPKSKGNLSFYPRRTSDVWTRFYAVLAIVVTIGLVQQGAPGGLLPMFARRWPHLLGVVAGLLCWFFLNPSLLGLIIVAVCLIASVRSGWQDQSRSDSAIVPLS